MSAEALTVREASFVAEIPCTAIHQAIDEQKLPVGLVGAPGKWLLNRDGVLLLAVEKVLEPSLSPTTRAVLRDTLVQRLQSRPSRAELGEVVVVQGPLRIVLALDALAERIEAQWRRLAAALELIVEDPEVQGGAPTFRGTRILVRPVAEALDRGILEAELLEDYPALTLESIAAARLYAAVRPPCSRPTADTAGLTPKSVRRVEQAA